MSKWEDLIRSKPARIGLVVALASFGAWSFAPHVLSDVSTRAAVNAPLIRLTAAVDGTVPDLPPEGRYFAQAADLRIVMPSDDVGGMAGIRAEAELAAATVALAERQLVELTGEESRLSGRSRLFAAATADRLAADSDAATAATEACRVEHAERAAALARAEQLATSGFMSPAAVEKARSAAALTRSNCKSDQARLEAIMAMQAAAARGVYLGDSYNDTPYAEQQRDRLWIRRQELERTAVEARARRLEADRQLAQAQARTHYAVRPGSLLWAQLSSPGAAVRAGSPVLDIVDCRRRFVDVSLPERRAEAIRPGQAAHVRLIGSDEWQSGRVVRIHGAAARRSDDLFAVAFKLLADDHDISVEVALPAPDTGAPSRRCEIGRLAEVRFDRRWA